jgi:hypothetical protein
VSNKLGETNRKVDIRFLNLIFVADTFNMSLKSIFNQIKVDGSIRTDSFELGAATPCSMATRKNPWSMLNVGSP